jgi:hypothetical protein
VKTLKDIDNTVENAHKHARGYCSKNKGWKTIQEIGDTGQLYEKWADVNQRDRKFWQVKYGESAKDAWESLSAKRCMVPVGFIGSDGEFYESVTSLPYGMNFMMVFKTGET